MLREAAMRVLSLTLSGLLFTAQAFACGIPQLGPNTRLVPKTFVYEEGWPIPGLKGAHVTMRGNDAAGGEVVRYRPTVPTKVELQGFDISADGNSIRLVPGYVQFVESIAEYRVQNRTYAYTVVTVSLRRASPPMWQQVPPPPPNPKAIPAGVLGCGWTTLRYYDKDGDGRFESMEYVGFGGPHSNSTPCETTPDWALQLLPNLAAARRCEVQIGQGPPERDLKAFLAPLAALLSYTPPKPMLVTK
jgi:hypothetical protein